MGRIEKTLDLGRDKEYQIEISPKSGLVIGKVHGIGARESQQDAFGVSDIEEKTVKEKGLLCVLADGMGGMSDGEKASMAVVIACLDYFEQHKIQQDSQEELIEMLHQANCKVREELGENAGYGGATAIVVLIKEQKVSWVSVGDSRLYLFRDGELRQLNQEHNYAAVLMKMVENGEIGIEEAMNHPQRKALTSFIGVEQLTEIDRNQQKITLKKGDRLLMMSDGVFGTLSEEEIIEALNYPAEKSAMYLGMKIEAGKKVHQDNYTAIIVEVIAKRR